MSEDDADLLAKKRFAENIETIVISSVEEKATERNNTLSEETRQELKVATNITLRGITVTARYREKGEYYSLVKYGKDEYNQILADEMQKEIDRNKKSYEYTKLMNSLREKKEREELRASDEKNEY